MNNLKKLRLENNLMQKELASMLKIAPSTLSYWEQGRFEPDIESLQKLANIFGVSIDELLGRTPPAKHRIPVYGDVAAGIPIEAITNFDSEDPDDWEDLAPETASKGEYIALRIHGDSMEPRMKDGDVVIVRLQPEVNNGEIAIVQINGDSATCKKINKTQEGLVLISLNSSYEPMFFTPKQCEELPIRIIGKVVELRAKF